MCPSAKFANSELYRDQRKILDKRVAFFVDPAEHIDVEAKSVKTKSGKTFTYDYLVIATGSRIKPEAIPGMVEGGHWFYDLDGARKMRDALNNFKGGKIVVNVNVPHKCPVAPLEIVFMLREYLAGKGIENTEITYTYPIGRLHALEPVANWAGPEFQRCGIKSEVFFNTKSVDPKAKTITSEEGVTLPYDLLVTIPPHSGQQVIVDSKLGDGGWVPTNKQTLLREGSDNVFIVGDTTNIPISKARIDGAFRGRYRRRQPRVLDQGEGLVPQLRRKGLLLPRDRHEHRNLCLVQLHDASEPSTAVASDPLVQARL